MYVVVNISRIWSCFPKALYTDPCSNMSHSEVAKFCNKLPVWQSKGQVWVFFFLVSFSVCSPCHLMKDPTEHLGFQIRIPISRLGREYTILSPSWPDDSLLGGRFCLKVSCQPRVCLAPSCNETIIWPVLSACPLFCAYPTHPPTYGSKKEEEQVRKRPSPWIICGSLPQPPGLNLQCPSL